MPRGRPRKNTENNDKPIYINTEGKVKTYIWSRMSKTEYWRMKYRYMMNRPVRSAILVVAIVMAYLFVRIDTIKP